MQFLEDAKRSLDDRNGQGYSERHPYLPGMLALAMAVDYRTMVNDRNCSDLTSALRGLVGPED